MDYNKISIIGSGISGISLAKMVSSNKNNKVEIYEKESKIGGLIKCDIVNGNLFHKVGGHVFNSKNDIVLNWFWSFFNKDLEFISTDRNAKILMNDELIGYPIENYIYQLPAKNANNIINELLEKVNIKNGNTENFEKFLINNFGNELYHLYFKPYNEKIWQTDLSKIPLEWLDGKLPMPNLNTILINNIIRSKEDNMVHSKFWYPKQGGSQFIIDRLSLGLNINTQNSISSINYINGELTLNNHIITDNIIYTGNVKNLLNIIEINDIDLMDNLNKLSDFVSNGTSNMLCETDETDLSWLYIPENKYKAHRIIYTGNFSPNNNSKSLLRKTCVVEFSGKHSIETMLSELNKLPGNLKYITSNYEEDSYVIQNSETRKIISDIKKILKKYNIYLHGRFAEWEYYNMDICIEKSMELSKIFNK